VPEEGGDKKPAAGYPEERETGDTGSLPGLWNEGVQNRPELTSTNSTAAFLWVTVLTE